MLIVACSSFAQQTKIDSLVNLLENAKEDTTKAKALGELAIAYIYSNPDTAFTLAQKEFEIAKRTEVSKLMASALNTQGATFLLKSDYPNALKYFRKSIKITEELGDKIGTARTYNNIGLIYDDQGKYPNALKYYHKSLKIAEELGDKIGTAGTYNNIGLIYYKQGDCPNSLKYYHKALKINKEFDNKRWIAINYNNIGNIYNYQGDYPKALKYYHKSLKIEKELGEKSEIASSYSGIGLIYAKQGDYPEALKYFHKSLNIKKELKDKNGMASSYGNIGNLYTNIDEYGKAFVNLSKTLGIAKEIGSLPIEKGAYDALTELYEKQKDYKNAFKHHQLYVQAKDSLFNEEKSKEIGKLEAKYEFEKKLSAQKRKAEADARIEDTRVKRRNLLQYSVIFIVIILMITVVFFIGKLPIGYRFAEFMVFMIFLLSFETVVVFLDTYIEQWTGGEPVYKLTVNALLAACIFPLHQLLEGLLKQRIVKTRKEKIRSDIAKVILIGLLSVGNATDIFANNQIKIDSINNVIATAKEDTTKIKALRILGRSYHNTRESLPYYEKALKLSKSINNKKLEADCYSDIGIISYYQGDYPNTLKYFHKSLKIKEELKDKRGMAGTYNNIGNIYTQQDDYLNALKYFHKALKINQELDNKRWIAYNYNNIGAIYFDQGDYPNALKYYHKDLEITEELGDKKGISMTYNNIGGIYYEQGDYPNALKCFHKSLKMKEELGNKYGMAVTYIAIGTLNIQIKEYHNSFENLSKGLEIAQEIGALLRVKEAYEGLTELYKKQKDYKNAYEYHKLYSQAKDSLFNEEKSKEIGKLEAKYELGKKLEEENHKAQEQARLADEETARRNLFQYSGILIFIIALFTLALFAGKLRPPVWVAELLAFIPFLILFEGILVYIDPTIENLTGGEPLWKLIVNAVLAGMIFPFHQYFESKLKSRIRAKKKN